MEEIVKIENEYLNVEINSFGAEMFSLKSKITDVEYLWQGDPNFWKNRAPILFPICGRLFEGKYNFDGKEYNMPLHGIAKLYSFVYDKKSDSKVIFTLNSNESTKEYYPFDFIFSVIYELKNSEVHISVLIKNNSQREMPFSYGFHPGFNVPFDKGDKFEDYYLQFPSSNIERIIFSSNCLRTSKTQKYYLQDGKIKLRHELFNEDALFFVSNAENVQLISSNRNDAIEVSYAGMTSVGVWQKPNTVAPFICIEPWHGSPSYDGVVDDFDVKDDMVHLKSGESYKNTIKIKIKV